MQRLVDRVKGFAGQAETGGCHAVETIEYLENKLSGKRSEGGLVDEWAGSWGCVRVPGGRKDDEVSRVGNLPFAGFDEDRRAPSMASTIACRTLPSLSEPMMYLLRNGRKCLL
jgi:hypothetical protein